MICYVFVFSNMEQIKAYRTCIAMREVFAPAQPMEKLDHAPLWIGAEVSRCSARLFQCWGKVNVGGHGRGELREDMCKELRALRKLTDKKESEPLPKPLLAEVTKVLWDK